MSMSWEESLGVSMSGGSQHKGFYYSALSPNLAQVNTWVRPVEREGEYVWGSGEGNQKSCFTKNTQLREIPLSPLSILNNNNNNKDGGRGRQKTESSSSLCSTIKCHAHPIAPGLQGFTCYQRWERSANTAKPRGCLLKAGGLCSHLAVIDTLLSTPGEFLSI